VKRQRRQILLKLGARNMTHAVALAAVERLIELERVA
jgi:DNA-binding CsgD family transcriptional regulator